MHGYGGMAMGLGMIWYWIIGVIILVAVVWIITRSLSQNRPDYPNKSALDILKERYARGEIDKQEFDNRKKDLM